MPTARRLHDLPGTLVALGFIALGAVLALQTGTMTPMGSVFPITISIAMIVLASILIARNVVLGLRARPAAEEAAPAEAAEGGGSNWRRALFLAAMVAWIALLPVLGFLAASAAGFFAVMAIAAHERLPVRQLMVLVLVGLAILGGFYLLMADVLMIPLPRGLLI